MMVIFPLGPSEGEAVADCKHIETIKFLAQRVGGVKALAEMVRNAV